MESVNLTALFRSQAHNRASSLYTSPSNAAKPAHEVHGRVEDAKVDLGQGYAYEHFTETPYGDVEGTSKEDLAALYGDAVTEERRPLNGRNDPTSDTTSLKGYWHALFSPQVYMPVFYALRITLLVGLPLGIIARHPTLVSIFPAQTVLPLWGVVDCRYTFGEQVAANIAAMQCGVWIMVWGLVNNAWGVSRHNGAWWCSVMGVAFGMSLIGDVRARRVLVLLSVLILQMQRLNHGTELIYPVKVGRDLMFATSFAFFQNLFPLRSIAKACDADMAKGWKHIGAIVRNAVEVCWSEDPVECAVALGKISTEPIQARLTAMPGRFFFIMYEFWESTLRLELRRERLALMELCMPRLHAITDSARVITMTLVPRYQYQFQQKQRRARDGSQPDAALKGASHEPCERMALPGSRSKMADDAAGPPSGTRRALATSGHPTLWRQAEKMLRPAVDEFLDALDKVLTGLGEHLNPHATAERVPFDALRRATEELQARLNEVHFRLLIVSEEVVDPLLYSNILFFHLSLVVLAERLLQYGEKMKNFDRKRYKSQLQRTWEFFFYDYWRSFWDELPKRLTLATPRDVRILKDAIKISCAYGMGVMFTEYVDEQNVYNFGMAILMGVSWPTAGDTMEASVYRVTGMVCACSIAYIAIWHTSNLAQELALALAGLFVALLFRDRPPYSHTAQYCSMLILTSLNSASTKLVLLSRIVSNCFTVMAYYAIVTLVFPIDVLRVTYNAQVKGLTMVADRFSRLVDAMNEPLHPPTSEQHASIVEEVLMIRDSRVPMWAAVNAIGMWLPKAASEPAPIGSPYPLREMRDMYSSLRRLASATDVISAALTSLHRQDALEERDSVQHILSAVAPMMQLVDRMSRILFQDFLDAFSCPHEWQPLVATAHLSNYLSLSNALHHSFVTAHNRHVMALRANFHDRVMNRTFAAAAHSRVLDSGTLDCVRNRSFALRRSSEPVSPMLLPQGRRGAADQLAVGEVRHGDGSGTAVEGSDATGRSQFRTACDAAGLRPADKRGALVEDGGAGGASAGIERPPQHLTNGSISRTIAEQIAMMRSQQRRNSRLIQTAPQGRCGGDDDGCIGVLPYGAAHQLPPPPMGGAPAHDIVVPPVAGKVKGAEGDDSDALESQLQAQETQEWEAALHPLERVAEEAEYHHFVTPHLPGIADMSSEYSLSHDVNMLISILVGTDMFFAEAERMLKTMYVINDYARSREPLPRGKAV